MSPCGGLRGYVLPMAVVPISESTGGCRLAGDAQQATRCGRHADDHNENAFVYVHLAYGRCGKLSVFVSFYDVVERYPLNAVTCVRNCVR